MAFLGVVFDPFDLSLEVTPKAAHEALKNMEFTKALVMSLKLNEPNLVTLVLERVPYSDSKYLQIVMQTKFAMQLDLTTGVSLFCNLRSYNR